MCPLRVLSFLLLCGPRPSAEDSQQAWDGACTMRVGTSYCQVTGVIPKSSGVPCLHEETLHIHSENWQFSSLVLNDSKSQPDCKSQLGSQELLWGSLLPEIQISEKQTKPSYTYKISDRTAHPLLGQRAAVTPASSLLPMLPEPQCPSVTFSVCYPLL